MNVSRKFGDLENYAIFIKDCKMGLKGTPNNESTQRILTKPEYDVIYPFVGNFSVVKKGKYYEFIVLAVDGSDRLISTSKVIHAATKGGKITNPKKVIVQAKKNGSWKSISRQTLKKGKALKLKVKFIKQNKKGVFKKKT